MNGFKQHLHSILNCFVNLVMLLIHFLHNFEKLLQKIKKKQKKTEWLPFVKCIYSIITRKDYMKDDSISFIST